MYCDSKHTHNNNILDYVIKLSKNANEKKRRTIFVIIIVIHYSINYNSHIDSVLHEYCHTVAKYY